MKRVIFGLLLIVIACSAKVEAHAFLERAEPAVGSTVQTSPGEVRVLFTEKIEPALSSVQVFDASGKEVDKRDVHLDRSNQRSCTFLSSDLKLGATRSFGAWFLWIRMSRMEASAFELFDSHYWQRRN